MVVRGDGTFEKRVGPYLDRLSTGDEIDAFREALGLAEREVHRVAVVGGGPTPSVEALGATVDVVVRYGAGTASQDGSAGLALGAPARLPLAAATLDAVVVPALHAAGPVAGLFEESARVLRDGGVLVVRSADPSTVQGRGLRAVEYLLGRDATFLTPGEVVARSDGAGLDATPTDDGWRYTVAAVRPARSARS